MTKSLRVALFIIIVGLCLGWIGIRYTSAKKLTHVGPASLGSYVVVAWNDLGMHCYNRDDQDLTVLPPYNNLRAQVIRVGDPPQIVTTGITVSYGFPTNTYSVGKTNFWTYSTQLFGVTLADNIGLAGKGLSGQMDLNGSHFEANGIPLTEFNDSAPTTPSPFQLATVTVTDQISSAVLATVQTVAPISSEIHCDRCHNDYGLANPNIATGRVETNILTFHDREEGTTLMASRPVLCANCHADPALGTLGKPGLPTFSSAMHGQHSGEVPNTLDGCYNCHPGTQTRCLRDVMSQNGLTCINCHGGMSQVAAGNRTPWVDEPRCDNAACHGSQYALSNPLFKLSTEHGGLYCEACHDSTHAIAPSSQPNDAIKFIALQGQTGTLRKCTVCHATQPSAPGPHGLMPYAYNYFMPLTTK